MGNATLFRRTSKYTDWKAGEGSCTLLCMGKLGSGKSVLLANIVDDLNLNVQTVRSPVAYFFCRHDISESLKARTVISSLARQLLHPFPDLTKVEDIFDRATPVVDFEAILASLRRILPSDFKAYFVLDGLDEFDDIQRHELVQQLRMLQDAFALLLCVSFRLEADNVLRLSKHQFAKHSAVAIPEDNADIKSFIGGALKRCIKSGKLTIGDPMLILEIEDALLADAHGMFLWVALQIESLCGAKTDEAIRQALVDLPKDLPDTFSRILQRSAELGKQYQARILELLTVAHRPLTTEELREALSVVLGDTMWNPARLLNNVYSALASCGGLIMVDEEDSTVRLIHQSVKQFLLSGIPCSTGAIFTSDRAKRTMAGVIVTYLNYGIFDTQLSITVIPRVRAEEAPSRIIGSMDAGSRNLALNYLNRRGQPKCDIRTALAEASKKSKSHSADQFQFYLYAVSYWLQHGWCISDEQSVLYPLLLRLLKQKIGINSKTENGQTSLSRAAENGYEVAVKLLVEEGADVASKDINDRTPLSWVAENGHEAVIKLLVRTGADPESRDINGRTPLSWAAENGHEAVNKLLLRTGADSLHMSGFRLRSRSEVDTRTHQEQVREARRKFEAKERAKEEKYLRSMKQGRGGRPGARDNGATATPIAVRTGSLSSAGEGFS